MRPSNLELMHDHVRAIHRAITGHDPPQPDAPPFDVISTERELLVELGVPGVDRDAVDAVVDGERLVVTGARSPGMALDGRVYLHAELPRGPFRREIRLPAAVSGRPRVEVDNGIVRVRITRSSKSPLPQA